ncbi:hypothetical protein Naga_100196g6 [Nannochloropsis gaditana]|uniref:Uncharacterized protein n=1 Tax=Nannochloropsis gaditana TaxID=72520 RepID=W7TE80_9STRA|nr:hypothetical protein Naga_100196g6 [Nannochloropsis gaditana]
MGRDGWRDNAEKCSMGLYQRLGWTQWEEGEYFECGMDASLGGIGASIGGMYHVHNQLVDSSIAQPCP